MQSNTIMKTIARPWRATVRAKFTAFPLGARPVVILSHLWEREVKMVEVNWSAQAIASCSDPQAIARAAAQVLPDYMALAVRAALLLFAGCPACYQVAVRLELAHWFFRLAVELSRLPQDLSLDSSQCPTLSPAHFPV